MALAQPLSDDLIDLIAQRFRVLGEPMRIKLLDRLRTGEVSVLELAESTRTTQQNVSKHLGVLHGAGLVARRKQGNFTFYTIADESVFKLCEDVCGSVEAHLRSLRELVEGASR